MKTRNTFAATATAAVAFLVCSRFPALAQNNSSPATPAPGTPTAITAHVSPVLMAIMALNADVTDPSQTSIALLIMHPDVRTELRISASQRQMLNTLQLQARQQVQAQTLAGVQQMRAQTQSNQTQQALTPQEQGAQMQQAFMQALSTVMENMEKPIETILSPEQMSRLHQLDLQWRGPLAMVDSTVADALQLTPDQRTYVALQFQQYYDAQQQLLVTAANAARGTQQSPSMSLNSLIAALLANPNGSQGNGGLPGYSNPQNAALAMAKLRAASILLQRTTTNKVLAALSPVQLQQWQVLQGAPFRTNF